MKKTFTANISGTVFHIEEDAFARLQDYLAGIRRQLEGTAGQEEIMADVEARVAELFQERLQGRQAVSTSDVEHVVERLGQPEVFGEGERAADGQSGTGAAEPQRGYKRLFRDTENKWVAGVLGGLAAYIGMDPIWLRVIMLLLLLLGKGTPILIYVLLWILVPRAESAADRLRMQGEPVTVDNLKRAFEMGGKRVADDVNDLSRRWSREGRQRTSHAADILGKVAGAIIVLFGFSLLFGLVSMVIGGTLGIWHTTWAGDELGLLDLADLVFESRSMALWMVAGALLIAFIPVIAILLAGFRLLLGTVAPAWLGWSMAALWIAALVPTILGGLSLAREFHRRSVAREDIVLASPAAGTLYLDALPWDAAEQRGGSWPGMESDDDDAFSLRIGPSEILGSWARLDVERSPDSLFHLVVVREARGRNGKQALANAEAIVVKHVQEGDLLRVSRVIRFPRSGKLRFQDARFTLLVPQGQAVFFRPGAKEIIHDVDNVTNTHDRDMLGRSWRMTTQGLEEGAPSQGPGPERPTGEKGSAPAAIIASAGEPRVARLPSLLPLLRMAI